MTFALQSLVFAIESLISLAKMKIEIHASVPKLFLGK